MANYQGKHVTKRSRRAPLSVWLAYLLVATLIASGVTFSGYVTETHGSDSARVAAFVFHVGDMKNLDLSEIKKPKDEKPFTFIVSNAAGKVSEVEETYIFNMELRGSLPLECELSGDGEKLTLVNDGDIATINQYSHTFQAAVKEDVEYTLTVKWPEDQNSIEYSRDGTAQLVVSVLAEQVD